MTQQSTPSPEARETAEQVAITAWRSAKAKHIEATAAYNAALERAKITDASRGFGFTNLNDEYQAMTEAANAAHRLQAAALDALYAAPVSQAEPSTSQLATSVINAARDALNDSIDALDTINIPSHLAASLSLCLDEYDSAARASHEEKGQG